MREDTWLAPQRESSAVRQQGGATPSALQAEPLLHTDTGQHDPKASRSPGR